MHRVAFIFLDCENCGNTPFVTVHFNPHISFIFTLFDLFLLFDFVCFFLFSIDNDILEIFRFLNYASEALFSEFM